MQSWNIYKKTVSWVLEENPCSFPFTSPLGQLSPTLSSIFIGGNIHPSSIHQVHFAFQFSASSLYAISISPAASLLHHFSISLLTSACDSRLTTTTIVSAPLSSLISAYWIVVKGFIHPRPSHLLLSPSGLRLFGISWPFIPPDLLTFSLSPAAPHY